MFRKAKVKVTVHRNPVQHVILDDSPASNIHFGEMTESHARRHRRWRRKKQAQWSAGRPPAHFW